MNDLFDVARPSTDNLARAALRQGRACASALADLPFTAIPARERPHLDRVAVSLGTARIFLAVFARDLNEALYGLAAVIDDLEAHFADAAAARQFDKALRSFRVLSSILEELSVRDAAEPTLRAAA